VSQPDDPNLDEPPGLSLNYKQAGNLEFIKEKTARNVCYTKQQKKKKYTFKYIYYSNKFDNYVSEWKMTTENIPSDILKSFTASSEPRLFSSSSPLRVTIIVHVVRSNKQPITSPLFQRLPNCSSPPCHHCP